MPLTTREAQMLGWLEERYQDMLGLLAALVNTDSGSFDRLGVDRTGEILRTHLEERGIACEIIGREGASFCLKAGIAAQAGEGRGGGHVLLLGHRDTVYPAGTTAERPFRMEGGRAFGPGVADMKAGLVMNTFVLEAIAKAGGARHPLRALYTSDEEIASPASRPVIEAAAQGARAVFNAEPGRPSGAVVTGRKGAMFLTLEVEGKAAHSGSSHEFGRSAIEELCRKVIDLHALTDYASGTTVNVGLIEGGQSVNTVAPHARARMDVRFRTLAAMADAAAAVEAIVASTHVAGTRSRITERAAFLPLEETPANRALFEHYAACAAELGMTVAGEFTGGSADSGFTSAVGAPTVCGVGPIGERAHSPDEVCHVDTLVPRAKALALAVLRLD